KAIRRISKKKKCSLGSTEAAGILPDGPLNAPVGGSVMFTTFLTEADGPFDAVTWNFNATILIISYQSGSSLIPPAYQDRITFFPSTASLELKDLTLDDGGEYSVNVFPDRGGIIKLDIYGNLFLMYINIFSIKSSTEQITEGSSVTLTCEASGSSPSRTWKKDGSDLNLSENVTLSEDNTVLTFKAVKKENSGEYVCLVSNPVSSISDPVNILVKGSNITLKCSTDCRPSAQLMWFLNGAQLPDFGAELISLHPVFSSSHGTYQCRVSNPVSAQTAVLQLTVSYGPYNVSIIGPSAASSGDRVILHCLAASVPPANFSWMFNGSETHINSSLYVIERFQAQNSGDYSCTAMNTVTMRENSTVLNLRGKEKMFK
uniref:Ig-like domain-containing protein n=1 Tax=Oryzias melastigma TaxID=30732 RepID=A0A3B3DP58_ORYME